jgi:hypothetical protein
VEDISHSNYYIPVLVHKGSCPSHKANPLSPPPKVSSLNGSSIAQKFKSKVSSETPDKLSSVSLCRSTKPATYFQYLMIQIKSPIPKGGIGYFQGRIRQPKQRKH